MTFIDFTAAFDSISHKFMDKTLTDAGASLKSRQIFRAIYTAATGVVRVNGTDGEHIYSKSFKVSRGVIQGDIISSVLFILALDQIMQQYDGSGKGKGGVCGKGLKCGRVLRIKVLGYADDLALADEGVEEMTSRVTKIADAALEQTDMQVNVDKTFTQHVHERTSITVSAEEVAETGVWATLTSVTFTFDDLRRNEA